MNYWNETLKDDSYLILEDGWVATLTPVKDAKGKIKKGDFESELIPFNLVIKRYFQEEQTKVDTIAIYLETLLAEMTELKEEHTGEEGLLAEVINDKGNITKGDLTKRIKKIKGNADYTDEYEVLHSYEKILQLETANKKTLKEAEAKLKQKVFAKYPELTEDEIKVLIVEDKWLTTIKNAIDSEIDSISQRLTNRITELSKRYEKTLPQIELDVKDLTDKVSMHLEKMGFVL
jgi:type I restriction enzyme M protein